MFERASNNIVQYNWGDVNGVKGATTTTTTTTTTTSNR